MSDAVESDREAVVEALAEARAAYAAARAALARAESAAAAAGVKASDGVETLTVQRINILEPDGELRLVLSNRASFPGIVMRGHEHAHLSRDDTAGLLFFNDEATETGGLIYGGAGSEQGHENVVHLSFDAYEQDQTVVLSASDKGAAQKVAQLEFIDRPEWSMADLLHDHDAAEPEALERLAADRPHPVKRMRLARENDGSVGLTLRDSAGKARIVMHVQADGSPRIELLNADGVVAASLPGS